MRHCRGALTRDSSSSLDNKLESVPSVRCQNRSSMPMQLGPLTCSGVAAGVSERPADSVANVSRTHQPWTNSNALHAIILGGNLLE